MVESTKAATFLQARALEEARGLGVRSDADCHYIHMCALEASRPARSCFCLLDPTPIACSWIEAWFRPRYRKKAILEKNVELQQQFLDAHDLLEGSIAAQVLATRQPQDTHREVCVLWC